jgi:hypothetical protein
MRLLVESVCFGKIQRHEFRFGSIVDAMQETEISFKPHRFVGVALGTSDLILD